MESIWSADKTKKKDNFWKGKMFSRPKRKRNTDIEKEDNNWRERLFYPRKVENIAKGTTDPGVNFFNQLLWFGLVGLVGLVW